MLDLKLMKANAAKYSSVSPSPNKPITPMDTTDDGTARVVSRDTEPVPEATQGRTKCKRTAAPVVETVDDEECKMIMTSTKTRR
jgi:hypothetical protein